VSVVTFVVIGPSGIAASNCSFGRKIWCVGCLGIEPEAVEFTLAEGKGLSLL
jgi:hypothetical protein